MGRRFASPILARQLLVHARSGRRYSDCSYVSGYVGPVTALSVQFTIDSSLGTVTGTKQLGPDPVGATDVGDCATPAVWSG